MVAITDPSRLQRRVARWVYFECPRCSHHLRDIRYMIEEREKIFVCPNCGARAYRIERLGRILLAMLVYGLVLLFLEFILDPSARLPWLFDASPWIGILSIGLHFTVLVALTWRWFVHFSFGWKLRDGKDDAAAQ